MKLPLLKRIAFSSRRRTSTRARHPLAAHRTFPPLIGAWGAALGGLAVMVLSDEHAARIAALANVGALGSFARPAMAAAAATILGIALYRMAHALRRKATGSARRVARAPIAAPEPREPPLGVPVALSNDTEPLPPTAGKVAAELTPSAAIMKLRQIPTIELSLIQMVERFAAAVHEHQSSPHAEIAQNPQIWQSERRAVLAEALHALSKFNERGYDWESDPADQAPPIAEGDTERQLRDALERLQTLRGAA